MCAGSHHPCRNCSVPVFCDDPSWLCPWVNGDEDALCRLCLHAAYDRRPAGHVTRSAPLHVLIHLHRTGGTTLRWIAARQYWKPIEIHVIAKDDPVETIALLPGDLLARLRLVIEAPAYGLHRLVRRPVRYLTMLRHPVARTISYYFYKQGFSRRGADGPGSLGHPNRTADDASQHSFDVPRHMTDNAQTRMLLGLERCPIGERITQSMLEDSIGHLRAEFDWIGTTERFDESVLLARRLFGWNRILYQHRNASSRPANLEIPPDVIRRIEDDNQYDLQLFAFAQQWITNAIAAQGPSFALELDAFQRLKAVGCPALYHRERTPPLEPDPYRRAIPDVLAACRRDHAMREGEPNDAALRSFLSDLVR